MIHAALALTLLFAGVTAVDRSIEARLQPGGIPGAAVVVVHDGKVVHARGFGVTSVETKTPVTTDTLFRLGSTAKMFTAAAALRLADAGRLRLDQPIGELVKDLPPPLRKLTLHQLLTHTAGLRDDAPMQGPLDESAMHARVTSWTGDAFFTTPGEVFSYANPGYVLAGDVIAAVHGKPFSETIDELVLRPAGMTRSTFRPTVAMTYPLALGHEPSKDGPRVGRPFAEHAGNYPPGSLFTSADDVGRFLIFLLDGTLLPRMAAPLAEIPAQQRHYGYGVIVMPYRGTTLVLHTGGRAGYGSIFMLLPKEKAGVAILANRSGAILSAQAFEAIDQYATGPEKPKEPETELPVTKEEIAQLIGKYVNNATIAVELAEENAKLVAKLGGRTLAVRKLGADRYQPAEGTQLETFRIVRDAQGRPRYLTTAVYALRKQD